MKITALETYAQNSVGFVRVTTDEGAEGIGQMSPKNADISAMVFHRQVAPYAIGRNPLQINRLINSVIEGEYKFPGSYVRRALAGLDTALWDLLGKMQNKGVYQLLGGSNPCVAAYGSSMRRDITPEDEGNRLVRLRDTLGYKAFKIRIGKVCGHDQDQWPGRTKQLVATVRKAVGDDIAIHVDANSCYTPAKAIEVGKMLEDYGVCHFEEPCPYWEIEWGAQVADALEVPVAGGEQDTSLAQFRRMIAMDAVDIVQPDICYIGGLSRALDVAKMAAERGKPCTPHAANLSMVTLFTMHMLAAIPNAGPYLEYSIEPTKWTEDLFYPALTIEDGKVRIPDGPGWGVTVNESWLKQSTYQRTILE